MQKQVVFYSFRATSVRGVTLTAAHLGAFLNSAQLACMAKFKAEPKYPVVKVTPLTEFPLVKKLGTDKWHSLEPI